jgi:hypothetical protein
VAGILASTVVLVVFAIDTFDSDPKAFWTMIVLPFLAVGLDIGWKRHRQPPARSGTLAANTP